MYKKNFKIFNTIVKNFSFLSQAGKYTQIDPKPKIFLISFSKRFLWVERKTGKVFERIGSPRKSCAIFIYFYQINYFQSTRKLRKIEGKTFFVVYMKSLRIKD